MISCSLSGGEICSSFSLSSKSSTIGLKSSKIGGSPSEISSRSVVAGSASNISSSSDIADSVSSVSTSVGSSPSDSRSSSTGDNADFASTSLAGSSVDGIHLVEEVLELRLVKTVEASGIESLEGLSDESSTLAESTRPEDLGTASLDLRW